MQILVGALIPFLAYITAEEHWRLRFLVGRDGSPLYYQRRICLAFDAILAFIATVIVHEAILVFL